MSEPISIAKRLRERGRVASLAGDRSAAWMFYRLADRFERPIANREEAIAKAQELGALMMFEPWPGSVA